MLGLGAGSSVVREAVAGASGDLLAGCARNPRASTGLQCHPLALEPASPGLGDVQITWRFQAPG